jgi:S-adenosylmethionine/arginine decarboxylase-like enzyme
MNNKPFGKHLIIDANDCKGELKEKDHIQMFINTLIDKLDMKKKGETIFEYFEDNDYNRERDIVGWSVVQIISLSSIVIHINEISKTIYLDVFTCGDLDELIVILHFSYYFEPSNIKTQIIIRDATKEIVS